MHKTFKQWLIIEGATHHKNQEKKIASTFSKDKTRHGQMTHTVEYWLEYFNLFMKQLYIFTIQQIFSRLNIWTCPRFRVKCILTGNDNGDNFPCITFFFFFLCYPDEFLKVWTAKKENYLKKKKKSMKSDLFSNLTQTTYGSGLNCNSIRIFTVASHHFKNVKTWHTQQSVYT